MANWKEKGVVPDSDDEDALDSQSTANNDDPHNEERSNDPPSSQNGVETHAIEEGEEEEEYSKQDDLESFHAATPVAHNRLSEQSMPILPTFELEKSSKHQRDRHHSVLVSPLASPKAFKFPKAFWEPGEDDVPEDGDRPPSKPGSGEPAGDEISRSYVQITSPTSSILSSLPGSQLSLPPAPINRRESTPLQNGTQEVLSLANPALGNVQVPGATIYAGRSLRQRNPIQLHPYIVEQEKYRRTLKARGIAPMRLASSQDESHGRSRQTASPELDSQERDSHDPTETGDSQPMDLDWDPFPSSSPQKALEKDTDTDAENNKSMTRNNNEDDGEDEEFPDIDKLLSTRPPMPGPVGSKRRIKSYSTKSKLPALSHIRTQHSGNTVGNTTSSSVFDIPASPPATSSPFPATSRRFASSTSDARSPEGSFHTRLAQREPHIQKSADLPTPATSVTKPIPILVDLDSDDPFTSERDISSEPSSSDESVQIRKVSKKIRGVLPASHLRLDYQQKKPQAPNQNHRDSLSISPIKTSARRGVALPKVPGLTRRPSIMNVPRFEFLSDDSDEEDEENPGRGFSFEDNPDSPLDSLFSQSRLGFAEEDDRIDAMLPSRKRQSTSSNNQQRKKNRVGSSALFRAIDESYNRQPKITEHLKRPRRSVSRTKSHRRAPKSAFAHRRQHDNHLPLLREFAPPRLSILDVADVSRNDKRELPQFIKIAARTARFQIGQGKQSPSRKFIRLANREDTHDAQSVLEDWREGRIHPKPLESVYLHSAELLGRPLREIEDNRQTTFQPPEPKLRPRTQMSNIGNVGVRRKLVISRGKQQSMNTFLTREQATTQQPSIFLRKGRDSKLGERPKARPRYVPSAARFAQLESSAAEHSHQYPAAAFRSTKKTLDALYRITHKRPAPQANLQLSRFLADEDVVRPSIEPKSTLHSEAPRVWLSSESSSDNVHNKSRRKKRSPQRLDTGAAMYRQPNDPLILDFLVPPCPPEATVEGRKLLGLAKFGTSYPLNFDVFQLQPRVFFHEKTFIGSGGLSEALKSTRAIHPGVVRPCTYLTLAGKNFNWGQWNEDVSSEMGVVFDWLVDQLLGQSPPLSSPSTVDALGVVSFVLEYVHHHLSFDGSGDVKNFLCRMTEILQDVSSRLEATAGSSKCVEVRSRIEVTSMTTMLLLELLRMARSRHEESLTYKLEDLLKRYAALCVKALLSQGLECVRKLYDDLQYLSFRENGIKSDEFVAQAWVIVMKVLNAARIPRWSFWDVTNLHLVHTNVKDISDARMMEKLWYSIFSLLPLCGFDDSGVVIEGQRQEGSFDNWSLPQQILKRVFALYSSNQRQSPGFNDYCRSIVSRCHYLMVEWGWWNCSGVIGTLFDFFGSHNLSHLRNEEAYASPHFLQELDKEPHLGLEPEDRCFHIFLKMVALAIKHFRQVGEDKAIRNLVARLLPNHNRQYPKEDSIHHRDLASLRNHHDLLCTLYWAAPSQYRPSPALIQELVVADNSHKEACLINLRAWEQLARFVLTHPSEVAAYQPLKLWYRDFFSKLVWQYLQVEGEVRDQAHVLRGTSEQILQESQLQEIIVANKATIMASMCTSVKAVADRVRDAPDIATMVQAFLTPDHGGAFDTQLYTYDKPSRDLLAACLRTITNFMDRVETLLAQPQGDDDISKASDLPLEVLETALSLPFPRLVKHHFEISLGPAYSTASPDKLYENLVTCWARYVAMITDRKEKNNGGNYLDEYVTAGPNAVFETRLENDVADHYWPHFLAALLKHKTSVDFENISPRYFDFGKEWLLFLTKPDVCRLFEVAFTVQLQKKDFALSAGISLDASPTRKLQGAIQNMGRHMVESLTYKSSEIKARYSSMLTDIMKSMQQHLEAMEPEGQKHQDYLKSVQKVAADIKCYGADICQLSLYFLVPSSHYKPDGDDPEFFAAGILSYCLRLGQQRERTSFELFWYLLGGWKKAFVSGEEKMHNHISHLKGAMKHPDFMNFLLVDFVPAILRTAFRSIWTHASLVYLAYLPGLACRVARILSGDEPGARNTFRLVTNLLRMIMNCLLARQDYTVIPSFPFPHRLERSVRTVACHFWLEVIPFLMNHVQRFRNKAPEDERLLQELHRPFVHYLERMGERLDPPYTCENDWMIPPWPVEEGDYCAKFEKALEEDIKGFETIQGMRGVKVGANIHWVSLSDYTDMMPTFQIVLQFGRIGREAAIPAVLNSLIRDVVP